MIADRYEKVRDLGGGAFGEVYEVIDHHLGGTTAALKLLKSHPLGIWEEAQVLRRVAGEHLLPVQNADLAAGVPFIVTDLATHGSIAEQITPHVGMPIDRAIRWGRQMCQGIARLHDFGLLHCDLKPENIFLNGSGDALVGDLGLAQLEDPNGVVLAAGSPLTMAPEVCAGMAGLTPPRCYSALSEVFSLGACVYWMLAGAPPRPLMSYPDLAKTQVPDIWEAAPHLPRGLRDVVNRSLSADVMERQWSPSHLDAALSAFRRPERSWTRVQPHPEHRDCFVGTKSGAQTVSVCVAANPSRSGFLIDVRYEKSQRALREHCGSSSEAGLGRQLRNIFRSC
ncbi:serine/threonine-protein kinase [Nesterenkonia halotolerans]|uniref:non-specific serine/threonine protein kinase n=2 Tax=Nesterenkonia halotolerans TaxID=225325 RepID=A0ABR9J5Y3_9MICC|nr:serine/threonine-protein kinase [Nesterenkonia halotolerans]